MFFKKFAKKIKRMDMFDIGLIKLSTFTFTLAFVTFSSEFLSLVQSIDWKIWFVIAILAMIRPAWKCLKK